MYKKIMMLATLCSSLLFSEMPEPYASVNVLPFDSHGWFLNANHLEPLIDLHQPKVVIEVGSWLGSSARFIASKLPEGAKLYAVDTWLGSPLEDVHMADPRLPYLYQLFLSNVIHAGLTDVIIPVRMNSLEAAKGLNIKADLIYLDASHDFNSVVDDILAWYPHLNDNGVLCGDDWCGFDVQQAVWHCAHILNKKVVAIHNFWWYADN